MLQLWLWRKRLRGEVSSERMDHRVGGNEGAMGQRLFYESSSQSLRQCARAGQARAAVARECSPSAPPPVCIASRPKSAANHRNASCERSCKLIDLRSSR